MCSTCAVPGDRGTRPRLLDLFSGAGGAAIGYHRAGFEVVGVDLHPQPRYPYMLLQRDALEILRNDSFLSQFDVIHASPPCQRFSVATKQHGAEVTCSWPDLVGPTRELLQASGKLYVIENVPGAPLLDPITLCGTMFPGLRVIRHRLFESNVDLIAPSEHPKHPLTYTLDKRTAHYKQVDPYTGFVTVAGGSHAPVAALRTAMGIEGMTARELAEALPPAYTEYIGRQLMAALDRAPLELTA